MSKNALEVTEENLTVKANVRVWRQQSGAIVFVVGGAAPIRYTELNGGRTFRTWDKLLREVGK